MGINMDAILGYGYSLGGPGAWAVDEVDVDGDLHVAWYDSGYRCDLIEAVEIRLKDTQRCAGVEAVQHDHVDHPKYLLTAHHVTASPSQLKAVAYEAGEEPTEREEWDDRLAEALRVLGLTPHQKEPAWLLASYANY